MGPPPPAAGVGLISDHPRPWWAGAGRPGQEDGRTQLDALGEETVVRVEATVTANAKAPGGVELTAPCITALCSPAATPPVELWRPSLNATLPTLLDHAPVLWRHRTQQAIWRLAAASVRGFRGTSTVRDSPRYTPRSWSPARPSPGPTSSPSTTSAARPTWPSHPSSTSRLWWGLRTRL